MIRKIEGACCLCGKDGKLSFEHVPPAKAYNSYPMLGMSQETAMRLGPEERPLRTRKLRRGMGAYTLCESCNNLTGGWYGTHFVEWCHRGMLLLERSEGKPTLYYPYRIYPLSVIKQIATMFVSVNGPEFRKKNDALVRFILNPTANYLPPDYKFFVYYNIEGMLRRWNVAGIINWNNTFTSSKFAMISEITHPPFGYVMTLDSPPPDRRLHPITHFARYFYNEIADIQLRLTTLPTHLALPGDYRTLPEIYQQAAMQGGSTMPIPDRL